MIRFSAGYMEGAAEKPHIRRIKERSHELLEARPIGRILDIGCGPGVDTVALALKFPAAQIVGVDIDPAMVAAADQNARQAGVGDRVVHQVAHCVSLPFATASFDAVRCERVFQHLGREEGAQAFDEAIRVTRAGGRIVLVETDWYTLSIHLADPRLERRAVANLWNHWVHAGAARALPELAASRNLAGSVERFLVPLDRADVEYLLAGPCQAAVAAGEFHAGEWLGFVQQMRGAESRNGFCACVGMILCAVER